MLIKATHLEKTSWLLYHVFLTKALAPIFFKRPSFYNLMFTDGENGSNCVK